MNTRQSSSWFTVDITHTIDDGYDYSLDCFPIRYVHELQHILRLCELRDLADNFKVELYGKIYVLEDKLIKFFKITDLK